MTVDNTRLYDVAMNAGFGAYAVVMLAWAFGFIDSFTFAVCGAITGVVIAFAAEREHRAQMERVEERSVEEQ